MTTSDVDGVGHGIGRLIDQDVIRLLLTIAETGGFVAAASRLGIKQPSVSQQVKRLEQAIGRPLFRRTRRGVDLTADGEAVMVYARAILGLTEDLRQRLRSLAAGAEVTVGMSEDFCRTALPYVLRLFMLDQPNIRVRILSGSYDVLTAAIQRQSVDFAIMRRYDWFPEGELIFREAMVWYGGRGLPMPIPDPVPLVLPLAPNPSRNATVDALRAAGRSSVIRFESIGIAGMETALAVGLGVCAGPRGMKLSHVIQLPDGHGLPDLPSVEFIMVRAGSVMSDVAAAFAQVIASAAHCRFGSMNGV